MEDQLWKIFENVNSWLKFSEKKNSLILAMIAAQLTVIKIFVEDKVICTNISLFVFMACLILAIISFFPKSIIEKVLPGLLFSKDKIDANDNLLFYGHIAKYSKSQYMKKMEDVLKHTIVGDKYYEDLCEQIIINSQITLSKLNLFKVTIFLMIFGQIFLFLSLF